MRTLAKLFWILLHLVKSKKVVAIKRDHVYLLLSVNTFKDVRKYTTGNAFLNDVALYSALRAQYRKVQIVTLHMLNKDDKNGGTLYFNLSRFLPTYDTFGNGAKMRLVMEELNRRFNCIPNFHETNLWENKLKMQELLAYKKIPTPETIVANFDSNVNMPFPFLIKNPHSSGSRGIKKITKKADLQYLLDDQYREGKIIFQKLLNIRRDLRVIVQNGQICLSYWRINQSESWKPTSTGFGSKVVFDKISEGIKDKILVYYKLLGVRTCAFDIAFENDDTDTTPLVLEFSTGYMPNPMDKECERPYNEFKQTSNWSAQGYLSRYVQLVFELKSDFVIGCFNEE